MKGIWRVQDNPASSQIHWSSDELMDGITVNLCSDERIGPTSVRSALLRTSAQTRSSSHTTARLSLQCNTVMARQLYPMGPYALKNMCSSHWYGAVLWLLLVSMRAGTRLCRGGFFIRTPSYKSKYGTNAEKFQ